MNTTRTYTMDARARSVAATRQRILHASFALATVRMFPDISLDDIASEAGVSVQTILRHFGSRDTLVDETIVYGSSRVATEMDEPVGDLDAAAKAIVAFYERRGDFSLLMSAQEFSHPQVEKVTAVARGMHEQWVRRVFAPFLGGNDGNDELFRLLMVATDVYTWKILRRDMRLTRAHTEQHIGQLLRALVPRGS